MSVVKRLQGPVLAFMRTIGRAVVGSPPPPRATGGYGLACRGALLLLFLIGLLVAWLANPAVGLSIMIVAALLLLQFFMLQYRGALRRARTVAWLLVVAAILGAAIGVVWTNWSGRGGASGDVLVLVTVIASAVLLGVGRWLFRLIFGPHHPESPFPDPDDSPPLWFWIGAVDDTAATVVARVAPGTDVDEVVVGYTSRSCDGESNGGSLAAEPDANRFARLELDDLRADTRYELRVDARRGGATLGTVLGSLTTFPPAGEPASLTMAFGSCMSTGSRGWVFDTIAGLEPRVFVVTGDLHYENITSRRTGRFLEAYDRVHASAPLGRLFRSTPMAYVWDDHDFGDNDADHSSPSKSAARTAYRLAVPSYLTPGGFVNNRGSQARDRSREAPDGSGAIHQEFTIGRVRVVITDNRSERGETPGHLIQPDAEHWLIDRIADPTWPVVIWVSPTPWIGDDTNSDNWSGYGEQRRRIATAIGDRNANLVMVSGDAHMVAIDDGEHSGYAGEGSGFPVLQAAAFDRSGSVKGGRFSHGKYPGAGQFGVVTIDDRGDEIGVELCGRMWTGAEIISHSFTIAVAPASGVSTSGEDPPP
jgi:hypothetical protein